MYKLKNIFLLCFLVATVHVSFGQIFSAYSQYGLGILNNSSSPVQAAMGGIGAAFIDGANVNYTNPAALSVIEEATFDFGLRLNTRSIANSANLPFTVADGGVNNISLSFPVMKNRWGMSFGLLPYSFSKYKSNATRTFDGKNYTTSAEGSGSLYKVYLGNGFHYKGFRAGLNAEFIFGKLENSIYTAFTDETDNTTGSRLTRSMSVRDIVFNLGVQYTADLTKFENREKGKEDLLLTVGAYFAPSLKVDAFYSDYLEATAISSLSGNPFPIDTASGAIFNQYSTTAVPTNIGSGISIGRKNSWSVGLDYDFKSWVNFNSPISSSKLTDEWKIKVGGFILPNNKSKKYFNRVSYRLGAHFGKAPIIHENAGVSDFGITFGFGLPLNRYKFSNRSLSNLNFAFEIGALGSNKNQNLVENYYNFTLTYTLSDFWFRRPKFD